MGLADCRTNSATANGFLLAADQAEVACRGKWSDDARFRLDLRQAASGLGAIPFPFSRLPAQ
jgi:hypothetical protein